MDYFLYLLIFCMGTVFGSFFTLAVYRIPLRQDIVHTRSYCPNCNHKLSFFDMIPILSYIFLGGKCRYCKQKIRPRYLMLEILSGLVFVLFAASIKFSIYSISLTQIIAYVVAGILYICTLFIIAGIDKEKIKIEKPVLLFGFICVISYIVYLYIIEKDPSIYRYVIYLGIIVILVLIDIFILRKKAENSYAVENLLLCMLLLGFTYEITTFLTITYTLICIVIQLLLNKLDSRKNKTVKKEQKTSKIPIGFYLCMTNIICLIITNFYIFYRL